MKQFFGALGIGVLAMSSVEPAAQSTDPVSFVRLARTSKSAVAGVIA